MPFGFTVRVVDKSRYFDKLFARAQDATRALNKIGGLLVSASRRAFDAQSYAGKAWPSRRVPNVMGVVRDLAEGSAVKDARFQDRPALVDTGRLRDSISYTVLGRSALRVGSTAPYAGLHNDGGVHSLPVTSTVKKNLAEFLRSHKEHRPELGFLFRRSVVSANVPARPFMGMTPLLNAQVNTVVKDFLLQRGEFAGGSGN